MPTHQLVGLAWPGMSLPMHPHPVQVEYSYVHTVWPHHVGAEWPCTAPACLWIIFAEPLQRTLDISVSDNVKMYSIKKRLMWLAMPGILLGGVPPRFCKVLYNLLAILKCQAGMTSERRWEQHQEAFDVAGNAWHTSSGWPPYQILQSPVQSAGDPQVSVMTCSVMTSERSVGAAPGSV